MTTIRPRTSTSAGAPALALRVLALLLGIFFMFQGFSTMPWLLDSGILAERLRAAGSAAHSDSVRWYIDAIATPGVPLFARLVPLAELSAGLALILGFWPRLVAAFTLAMVANFHFALGSYFSWEFLRDGTGLPTMGGLLALVIAGGRLPWSVKG